MARVTPVAARAEGDKRFGAGEIGFDWVDSPHGILGREALGDLVTRLSRVPPGARRILLDWRAVSHLDFRGIEPLVARLKRLRRLGIETRFVGIDAYMRAMLCFSLAEEGFELITGCAGEDGRSPAGARGSRIESIVGHLSAF